MSLGSSLSDARRRSGLTQEAVAERLGVSRQTISKWETDETLPDIRQAKRLSSLFGVSLDDLVDFDLEVAEIEDAIAQADEETAAKVDWTAVWAKQYPVLAAYPDEVDVAPYMDGLREMLARLCREHGYDEQDALLVLKDILGRCWQA